jgi:hypothetical protein
MSLNERLLVACKIQDMRLIKRLIELDANNFDECMIAASRSNHIEIVARYFSINAQLKFQSNTGISIVRYMINEGATSFVKAIAEAISNNHVKIVKFLFDEIDPEELGIFEAAENGNKEVIEFLQSKGYIKYNDSILELAASTGKLDLIKYMVSLKTLISDIAVENGIRSENLELVKYFIEQGENDFNYILDVSIEHGRLNITKYAIEQGTMNVNEALWDFINQGTEYKEIIRLLIGYATDQEAIEAAREEL